MDNNEFFYEKRYEQLVSYYPEVDEYKMYLA